MKNERWKRVASFEKLLFRGSDKLVGSLPRHTLSPPPPSYGRRRAAAESNPALPYFICAFGRSCDYLFTAYKYAKQHDRK